MVASLVALSLLLLSEDLSVDFEDEPLSLFLLGWLCGDAAV